MIQAAIYGRLGGDPKSIETSSGKPMTVASVAVDVGERNVEDPAPEWIGVVAFGRHAEALAKHAKGECVAVSGRVQRNRWTDRDGNERVQLQVIADTLISARTVRPTVKRRQGSGGGRITVEAMEALASGGERQQGTTAASHRSASDGRAPSQGGRAKTGGDFYDDEIPF